MVRPPGAPRFKNVLCVSYTRMTIYASIDAERMVDQPVAPVRRLSAPLVAPNFVSLASPRVTDESTKRID